MNRSQIGLLEPIIVDNFAGGGGASTGIELATGRPVTIAINHDPDAIAMHRTNHPYTEHYQASVWDVDPRKVCEGRPVGLAWFSPDCKHFSKAKGGKPVDKKIRGLAWIVLRWAGTVRPGLIILENVEEFVTWGPVRKGKPVKSKAGQTFQKWKSQLEALGYEVEHRELVAADYSAPTIRKRFFLIARCDGKPIVWPEPTHAPRDSEAVRIGKRKPWRSAAEIIDWSLPCPSIFDTAAEIKEKYGLKAVRPLADNTERRVARGLQKFVLESKQPFIVPVGYGERFGQQPRVNNIAEPLGTLVSTGKHMVCEPSLIPWTVTNVTNATGHGLDEPMDTVRTGGGGGQMLISPSLVQCKFDNTPEAVEDPLRTVTSVNAHMLMAAALTAIGQTGSTSDRGKSVESPIHTVVSKQEVCLLGASLIQYHSEQSEYVRGQGLKNPLMTVDAAGRYGLSAAYLTEYFGNAQDGLSLAEPLHTVTSKDREGVVIAHMEKFYSGGYKGCGSGPHEPLGTITAVDHNGLTATYLSKFYKTGVGQDTEEPLHTVTTSQGHFGLVTVKLQTTGQRLHRWPEVRTLLNRYCGYTLAEDELLLLCIGGIWYFISDIGLRMLTPRELYAASGFPADYIIDRDFTGKEYKKTKQVARCGNAVPPPFAEALVRANLPEWCVTIDISTMAELNRTIAI